MHSLYLIPFIPPHTIYPPPGTELITRPTDRTTIIYSRVNGKSPVINVNETNIEQADDGRGGGEIGGPKKRSKRCGSGKELSLFKSKLRIGYKVLFT